LSLESEYEPFFQPPGWVIGPVWAVLYTTLAISFTSILNRRQDIEQFNLVVVCFVLQLTLNLLWPRVFFDLEHYLISLLMIVGMVLFSVAYAYLIHETVPFASRLIWPYIAWVSFAGLINAAYLLNSMK